MSTETPFILHDRHGFPLSFQIAELKARSTSEAKLMLWLTSFARESLAHNWTVERTLLTMRESVVDSYGPEMWDRIIAFQVALLNSIRNAVEGTLN